MSGCYQPRRGRTTVRRPLSCVVRPVSAEVLEERVLPAVTIVIDYSLDNGFFAAAERRAAIEAVATQLSSYLAGDTIAAIPAGTYEINNPRFMENTTARVNVNFTAAMGAANTLRIFVSGSPLAGDTAGLAGPEVNTAVRNFVAATDFAPFAGIAGFDNDGTTTWDFSANPPVGGANTNFRQVARHELLHALGIGTAQSWEALITGGVFTGARARAANGGVNPAVVVEGDGTHGHFVEGVNSIMQPTAGATTNLTALDIAVLADIGWIPGAAASYAGVFGRTGAGAWMASRNANGLSVPEGFGQWVETEGWRDVSQGDFDNDGRIDVAGRTSTGQWWVGLNNGTRFVNRRFGSWNEAAGWRDVRVGDFNNDGRADVAGRTSTGQWWVARSTGTAFVSAAWETWGEANGWRDVSVGDFDNDGRADIAGRTAGGQWWIARSTGTAFQSAAFGIWNEASGWRDVRVADFSGDGRADILGRTSTGKWWLARSTGTAFQNVAFGGWAEGAGWRGLVVADFTGDAKVDLAARTAAGQWWVGTNTAGGFDFNAFGVWDETAVWADVLAANFAGGAKADIVARSATGQWWVAENIGTRFSFRAFGQWDQTLAWRNVAASVRVFANTGDAASPAAFTAPTDPAVVRGVTLGRSNQTAGAAAAPSLAMSLSTTRGPLLVTPADDGEERGAAADLPPVRSSDALDALFVEFDGGLAAADGFTSA